MFERCRAGRWAVAALLLPTLVRAQGAPAPQGPGLAIQHERFGCIVAEQHTKPVACFAPSSALARGQAFFRMEGGPHWYAVEFRPDAPCFATHLPKAKRAHVGKHVELYMAAVDRGFQETLLPQYSARIVASPGECDKDMPV